MLAILAIFAAGIILGLIFRKWEKPRLISERLSGIAVGLLLFLLGTGVGMNREIRSHIDTLGLTALLIALFAVAGSLLTATVTWYLFFRKK